MKLLAAVHLCTLVCVLYQRLFVGELLESPQTQVNCAIQDSINNMFSKLKPHRVT